MTDAVADQAVPTRLKCGQEPVMTLWKDGGWKLWGEMDAFYAQSDPDFLTNIPVAEVIDATRKAAAGNGCWPE